MHDDSFTQDIPFDQLAFSSVRVSLQLYLEDLAAGRRFRVHHGVIDKTPGSGPGGSDPAGFAVRQHMEMFATPAAAAAAAGAGGIIADSAGVAVAAPPSAGSST